jgi:hypothetical protein
MKPHVTNTNNPIDFPKSKTKINQRAQELACQAGISVEYLTNTKQIDLIEKFAELIIRECMACSILVGKMNTNSVEPVHTAHAINQRIKEHFGVEE